MPAYRVGNRVAFGMEHTRAAAIATPLAHLVVPSGAEHLYCRLVVVARPAALLLLDQ